MTDINADQLLAKINGAILEFTDGRKPMFSERLTKQLERLRNELAPGDLEKLQALSVNKVVNDVSSSVLEALIKKLSGLINPIPVSCLSFIPP